jgi:diguanylate cyclase (GGDEF)-like protein
MRLTRRLRRVAGRLSLTRKVALLSLLPMLALGLVLARVLQAQVVDRTLADATRSAAIIAHLGVQPKLTPQSLRDGLSRPTIRALDRELSAPSVGRDLARIKVWNARHTVIYSEDHTLIGRTLAPSDDLRDALLGHPHGAQLIDPSKGSETASEVGLGELIEIYVPLRFAASGPPAGAFEIYLSYRPVAAAVAADKRTIALLIAFGLALLWAILYRIVGRASRRLGRQADENYRLAREDALTGLANRTLFAEEAASAVRRAQWGGGSVAVLLIDLERFSAINNTLGSASGDEVLRLVAARLREDERDTELIVARIGGDEFGVLAPATATTGDALELASLLLARLESPILLEDVALDIEASVGVAVLGEHATSAEVLIQRADLALAHARSHGSRIEVYSPTFERSDASRLKLLGQVRGALAAGEFVLHYQPQVDLRTRRVTGVEALVRWQHPELGLLAPAAFIELVEQTALIGPLTFNVLEQALAQSAAWRRRGIRLAMSVNLSARNLLDPELHARIAALLREHDLPPAGLVVEVTESSAMSDPERGVRTLQALRAMGLGVSIDDFGTGNASIEYLAGLPATELKIDRSFVTGILHSERDQAIVRSTIDLARNLGLTVVAEGIEDEPTMEHLIAQGCDMGQGFHFGRPLPAEELTQWLSATFGLGGLELRSGSGAVFGAQRERPSAFDAARTPAR